MKKSIELQAFEFVLTWIKETIRYYIKKKSFNKLRVTHKSILSLMLENPDRWNMENVIVKKMYFENKLDLLKHKEEKYYTTKII